VVFLSVLESYRGVGVNPRLWLKDILDRIMTRPTERLHELLPAYWTPLPENAQLGIPV
jgi:hypothetical protein